MEGAEKAICSQFRFPQPACVKEAIGKYRADNDWMTHFLEECCENDPAGYEASGRLYEEYRSFCLRTGDFIRNATEFTRTLEQRGYERVKKRNGRFIIGIRLKASEFLNE